LGLSLDAIGVLSGLNVKSDVLNKEIRLYWEAKTGRKITKSDVERFKSWAWSKFKAKGYLAWLTVDEQVTQDRVTLNIEVTTPKLGQVDVDYSKVTLATKAQSKIDAGIRKKFKTDDVIDVLAMDNHIQNASFGLPLEFDARLKQVAPGITDLTIAARPVEAKPGKLQNAFIQFNSYGLKQYGREQLLASLTFAGFTPLSQLSVAAQVSEGVNYGRAEYQSPMSFLGGVSRIYASYADFSSALKSTTATRGESYEYGVGITHLLGLSRYNAYKSHFDLSERRTRSELKLGSTELTDLRSLQGRFSLSVDNSKVDMDQYDASMTLVGGEYQNSVANQIAGAYSKLELNGRYVWSLSQDRSVLLASRFRGQYAGTNLDSFDRI
jgi:hemolysin activation/secretion protein